MLPHAIFLGQGRAPAAEGPWAPSRRAGWGHAGRVLANHLSHGPLLLRVTQAPFHAAGRATAQSGGHGALGAHRGPREWWLHGGPSILGPQGPGCALRVAPSALILASVPILASP